MRYLVIIVLLAVPFMGYGQNKPGLKFDQGLSWKEVLAKAKAENKFIFVDCYTTWCGPCKQMDSEVYTAKEVGQAMNDKFIAVKVQFDQTQKDDQRTKSWYGDVKSLNATYVIQGFPTLLFLSPSGQLVHQVVGFQDPEDLIRQVNFAVDPSRKLYQDDIAAYKNGKKDPSKLLGLYTTTKSVFKDKKLSDSIASDYRFYLDQQEKDALLTKGNVNFIVANFSMYHTDSKFAQLLREQPARVDSLTWAGASVYWLELMVRQEFADRLWKGQVILTKNPDWNALYKEIRSKFPSLDAQKLIGDLQVGPVSANGMPDGYFHVSKDYQNLIKYTQPRIDSLAAEKEPNAFMINCLAYWSIFIKVPHDRYALQKGLNWVDLAIKLDKKMARTNDQILDTRANLLYKLGRTSEAIHQETMALKHIRGANLSHHRPKDFMAEIFIETIRQMKRGEKTGLVDGAAW